MLLQFILLKPAASGRLLPVVATMLQLSPGEKTCWRRPKVSRGRQTGLCCGPVCPVFGRNAGSASWGRQHVHPFHEKERAVSSVISSSLKLDLGPAYSPRRFPSVPCCVS